MITPYKYFNHVISIYRKASYTEGRTGTPTQDYDYVGDLKGCWKDDAPDESNQGGSYRTAVMRRFLTKPKADIQFGDKIISSDLDGYEGIVIDDPLPSSNIMNVMKICSIQFEKK